MEDDQSLAVIVLILLWAAGGIVSFVGYFVPSIIAIWRDHHQKAGIILLNLLVGWTGVFWVLALVWSVTGGKHSPKKLCPDCATEIPRGARVCGSCGFEFVPINLPPDDNHPPSAQTHSGGACL